MRHLRKQLVPVRLKNLRPWLEIVHARLRKLSEHVVKTNFFIEKNAIRKKSIFLENSLFKKRFWGEKSYT